MIGTDDLPAWSRAVARLPGRLQDVNFTAAYHRLYEVNGDGEARLFCYQDGDKSYVYPFLIRSIPAGLAAGDWFDISSAYGYSGPIASDEDPGFVAAADTAFLAYCSAQRVITEFVRFHPLLGNASVLAHASGMDVIHLRTYIAVRVFESAEEQFSSYESRNRNSIRKAVKRGVTVSETSAFDAFVAIYLDNMRHLQASSLYFFSPAFFEALSRMTHTDGFVLSAEHEGAVVGAAVFLCGGEYGHYFLASSNLVGRSLAAGNLLLHEGINRCRERGVRMLHLGGGLTGSGDDPLLGFKKSFSSVEVPYHIGRRIHREDVYRSLVSAWESRHPDLKERFSSHLQCYRLTADDHRT